MRSRGWILFSQWIVFCFPFSSLFVITRQSCLITDVKWCRLAVVFLAFDVFFAIFCVALACLIGVALCCCLPCIIAVLYAVGQVRERIYKQLQVSYLVCFWYDRLPVIYRKVRRRKISGFSPSIDSMSSSMRKNRVQELVGWYQLRQAADTWLLNVFFYLKMQ